MTAVESGHLRLATSGRCNVVRTATETTLHLGGLAVEVTDDQALELLAALLRRMPRRDVEPIVGLACVDRRLLGHSSGETGTQRPVWIPDGVA